MKRQDGEHGLFERLSETLTDPNVDRMFLRAREFEGAIEDATEDEQAQVAQLSFTTLDKEWIYNGTRLQVSGLLYGLRDGEVVQERAVEKPLVSRGFIFERKEMVVDDEVILGNWRAALHFVDPDAGEDDITAYNLFLSDIDHIEYPFPSKELRVIRYNYFHPESANEIFTKVWDSPTDNDAIFALRDMHFDMNTRFEDDVEELNDLTAYMNEITDFDKDVPWRFTLIGEVGVQREDGQFIASEIKSATHWYGTMRSIAFVSLREQDKPRQGVQRRVPVLVATLHAKDKGRPDIEAYIPFTTVAEIEALR